MYEDHDHFAKVPDRVNLWKFMDLPKFLNLLNGKLYFNRLNNFEDVYEGTYPKYNQVKRKDIYGETILLKEQYEMLMKMAQNSIYVSCFHNSISETAFMWKLYGKDDGVAIKTTSKRLKESFNKTKQTIYLSKVNYIDYNKEFLPEGNLMYLGTHKRKSFNAENEYRCIVMKRADEDKEPKGMLVDIDLEKLIYCVYISPYAPEFMTDDIRTILKNRGLKVDVKKSDLLTLL